MTWDVAKQKKTMTPQSNRAFESNLRALRKMHGMTQSEFAEEIGVTQSMVCNWENGRTEPRVHHIMQICYKFHISADLLLGVPKKWRILR